MASPSILGRIRQLREHVLGKVRQINQRTETDVLATGRHLQRVVEVAHRHIESLRAILAGPVGDENSDLARAIRNQSDHVRQHTAVVGGAVAQHAAEVTFVAEQVRSITTAAREIDRLNAAARVLSINARIEATRSGGATVFRTIANEMQHLSRSIEGTNKRIRELATAMEGALPRLVEQSESLAQIVEGYAVEARERIEHIDARVVELRGAVRGAVQQSDGALNQIVSESHAALSTLQFQDVCAQSLLQIDKWVATLARETVAALGEQADVAPEAHTTVGGDDIDVAPTSAGEVLLFA
ncbi:MAG: hypothetical protein ACTHU0_30640 [Kofleriaceae bacterium]